MARRKKGRKRSGRKLPARGKNGRFLKRKRSRR